MQIHLRAASFQFMSDWTRKASERHQYSVRDQILDQSFVSCALESIELDFRDWLFSKSSIRCQNNECRIHCNLNQRFLFTARSVSCFFLSQNDKFLPLFWSRRKNMAEIEICTRRNNCSLSQNFILCLLCFCTIILAQRTTRGHLHWRTHNKLLGCKCVENCHEKILFLAENMSLIHACVEWKDKS